MALRRRWADVGIVALAAAIAILAGITFVRPPTREAAMQRPQANHTQPSVAPSCVSPPRTGVVAPDLHSVVVVPDVGINDQRPLGEIGQAFVTVRDEFAPQVLEPNALPADPCGVIWCPSAGGSGCEVVFVWASRDQGGLFDSLKRLQATAP